MTKVKISPRYQPFLLQACYCTGLSSLVLGTWGLCCAESKQSKQSVRTQSLLLECMFSTQTNSLFRQTKTKSLNWFKEQERNCTSKLTHLIFYLIFCKASLQCCPRVIWGDPCCSGATKVTKFNLSSATDKKIFNLKTSFDEHRMTK